MTENTFPCIISGTLEEMDEAKVRKLLKKKYTIEFIKHNFIGKKALKLLKNGDSIELIRTKLKSNAQNLVGHDQLSFNGIRYKHDLRTEIKTKEPTILEVKQKRFTAEQKEAAFKSYVEHHTKNDICIRPDIFLNNRRSCLKCPYEKYCTITGRDNALSRAKEQDKPQSNSFDVILEIT